MGFKTEFNWALKLRLEQGYPEKLEEKEYEFTKDEYRVYPINIPIDLINKDIEAIAKIVVIEINHTNNKTMGKYKIIKIYNQQEKEFLTN